MAENETAFNHASLFRGSGSGFGSALILSAGSGFGGPTKKKKWKISCFEVLDVLFFCAAWTSFIRPGDEKNAI
jgi:hypothetical protein